MNNKSAVRNIGGFVRNSLAAAIGALTLAVASVPAVAADDPGYKLRQVRLCDTTGCYLAWNVVDSDKDGVADADELMAHTNPFDPLSRPSLPLIVELAEKNVLSSFEAGLGAFFVFPPELRAPIEKSNDVKGLLSAFPLRIDQPDGLGRLGISADLLKEHGIDLNNQGLTVGLELGSKDAGPEKRVGGIKLSLISAGDDAAADDYLEPLPKVEVIDGDRFTTFNDGTVRADWSDGGFTVMDKDGYVLDRGYINPDADTGSTVPTPEQEKNLLRLRGAVVRTVEGWSSPKIDDATLQDPRQTIIHVDPDYLGDTVLVFDPNNVTEAHPETRPDLPQPGMPAGTDPKTEGCKFGC
jgi:hypothetical protein